MAKGPEVYISWIPLQSNIAYARHILLVKYSKPRPCCIYSKYQVRQPAFKVAYQLEEV